MDRVILLLAYRVTAKRETDSCMQQPKRKAFLAFAVSVSFFFRPLLSISFSVLNVKKTLKYCLTEEPACRTSYEC